MAAGPQPVPRAIAGLASSAFHRSLPSPTVRARDASFRARRALRHSSQHRRTPTTQPHRSSARVRPECARTATTQPGDRRASFRQVSAAGSPGNRDAGCARVRERESPRPVMQTDLRERQQAAG